MFNAAKSVLFFDTTKRETQEQMSLPIRSTSSIALDEPSKSLLYAHQGWGKTYTARYFAEAYGKGVIFSGEAGLKSLQDVEIDYVPFTGWETAEGDGVAFKDLLKMMRGPDFKKSGYKWIMVDSLTELCDIIFRHYDKLYGDANGFKVWADYGKAVEGTAAQAVVNDTPAEVIEFAQSDPGLSS